MSESGTAASRPVRGGIEQRVRVDHRGAQRRPRAVQDHVREPLGPNGGPPSPSSVTESHAIIIAGPVVQHRRSGQQGRQGPRPWPSRRESDSELAAHWQPKGREAGRSNNQRRRDRRREYSGRIETDEINLQSRLKRHCHSPSLTLLASDVPRFRLVTRTPSRTVTRSHVIHGPSLPLALRDSG